MIERYREEPQRALARLPPRSSTPALRAYARRRAPLRPAIVLAALGSASALGAWFDASTALGVFAAVLFVLAGLVVRNQLDVRRRIARVLKLGTLFVGEVTKFERTRGSFRLEVSCSDRVLSFRGTAPNAERYVAEGARVEFVYFEGEPEPFVPVAAVEECFETRARD